MQNGNLKDVPVLIAGAGPAGLTAALALERLGVEWLLVERRRTRSRLPRATVVSTRSMEIFRSFGLEGRLRAGGPEVDWLLWQCETLARAAAGSAIEVGLPTREQSALVSPTSPACVPQDHLEPVLLEHVRSLAPGRVWLGTELVGLESCLQGVAARLRDPVAGTTRTVHARYVVAADGSRSTVRAALGIRMRGADDVVSGVNSVFRAPLWELLGQRRYGIYWVTHPDADGVFLPAGNGDRWGYGFLRSAAEEPIASPTEEGLRRLIRLGAGVDDLEVRIERIGSFSSAAQLAERFRSGDAFLVGDAAHRVTPRGGTGMNTAIHDAYDIGWKLGWVLRGWAAPGLLDTYEAERRPVAEHNAARSADPSGSAREAGAELRVDLAGRLPHVWLPSVGGRISTLDLLGPGVTLFTGPDSGAWEEAAAAVPTPLPLLIRRLDEITARALGLRSGGALLARPDGAPAALWPSAVCDRPALGAALSAVRTGGRVAEDEAALGARAIA